MSSKLIYLHGLNSAPQSTKATTLKAHVEALPEAIRPLLLIPALPHRPAEAMTMVRHMIDIIGAQGLTLIGSSLGGYYATCLAEYYAIDRVKAVLINPTTGPAQDLKPYMGRQRNLYTSAEYDLTDAHLREFLELKVDRLTDPDWAASLEPGWQKRRMENFNNLVTGIPEPEDLVGDGWTDIIGKLLIRVAQQQSGRARTTSPPASSWPTSTRWSRSAPASTRSWPTRPRPRR